MYKDLLKYELAEGVQESDLKRVAGRIIEEWMKDLEGFISWEICRGEGGVYTDIVCWENKESAKNAEKEMCNIPNASEWYGCYKEGSVKSEGIEVLFAS